MSREAIKQRRNISIHALREEGDLRAALGQTRRAISIHALREEGDLGAVVPGTTSIYFYPRPPRGGRPDNHHAVEEPARFLSTPSARRATLQTYRKL